MKMMFRVIDEFAIKTTTASNLTYYRVISHDTPKPVKHTIQNHDAKLRFFLNVFIVFLTTLLIKIDYLLIINCHDV